MQDLNDKVNNGGVTSDGQLSASEWNQLPSEVQNAIVSANIALSGGDLSQLAKSISHYATAGEFFTGAGSVNAYTATSVAPRVSPPALSDGMKIRIIAPSTNTGASTLNAFGTGAVNIKLKGGVTDVSSGDIFAGEIREFIYRTSPSAHWELMPPVATVANDPTIADDSDKPASTGWIKHGFSFSLGGEGYIALPTWMGGLIIQWGSGTTTTAGATKVFPLAFPTVLYGILAGAQLVTIPANAWVAVENYSLNQFNWSSNAATPLGFYIALGK